MMYWHTRSCKKSTQKFLVTYFPSVASYVATVIKHRKWTLAAKLRFHHLFLGAGGGTCLCSVAFYHVHRFPLPPAQRTNRNFRTELVWTLAMISEGGQNCYSHCCSIKETEAHRGDITPNPLGLTQENGFQDKQETEKPENVSQPQPEQETWCLLWDAQALSQ
jgi:hypothetical protein